MRALALLTLALASCSEPPGFSMKLLAPDSLLDEVKQWDLKVWAAADATCNGPSVSVMNGAPPVLDQPVAGGNQSVMLTVPSGARVFGVDGFSDASGQTRVAQGCQAATLETNVAANVTIHVVRVGGPPPRLVFGSTQNGFGMTALFVIDNGGGTPKQVTTTPLVSPGSDYDFNGGSVVFTGIAGATQLFTARVDGVGDTALPFMGGSDQNPLYSFDGTKIAFVSLRTGMQQVEVLDLGAMKRTQVSQNPSVAPGWSRDSTQLAWVEKAGSKLVVAKADGSAAKTMSTPALGAFAQPVWRQGSQVIVAVASTGKDDLVVWDAASDLRVTTLASLPNIRHPSLSPDGNVLLFVADGASMMGDGDIYKYDFNASGAKLTPLAATASDEDWPAWAPAQNQIALTVDSKVEVAAPDGSGARRLTQTAGGILEVHPLFAPVQ